MIPTLNPSVLFLTCTSCLVETPPNTPPSDYARIEVGITKTGDLIVWCRRHDAPIAMMKNGSIDLGLAELSSASCGCCGGRHEDGGEKIN